MCVECGSILRQKKIGIDMIFSNEFNAQILNSVLRLKDASLVHGRSIKRGIAVMNPVGNVSRFRAWLFTQQQHTIHTINSKNKVASRHTHTHKHRVQVINKSTSNIRNFASVIPKLSTVQKNVFGLRMKTKFTFWMKQFC